MESKGDLIRVYGLNDKAAMAHSYDGAESLIELLHIHQKTRTHLTRREP
jgi:hypothetical protein